MYISLKKFGNMLVSREAGREARLAFLPSLDDISDDENLEIDFDEVSVLNPSWADEFITPLKEKYGDRVVLMASDNPSVIATLDLLGKVWGKF